MIKNFKEFLLESLRDKMTSKSDDEIDNILGSKTKDELIQLYLQHKEEYILKYLLDNFGIKENPLNLDIDKIIDGYLYTAIWVEELDDVELDDVKNARIDLNKLKNEITFFISLANELLEGLDESTIGHNLWLTRNNHGTGFWDMVELDNESGEEISNIARMIGEDYHISNILYEFKPNKEKDEDDDEY